MFNFKSSQTKALALLVGSLATSDLSAAAADQSLKDGAAFSITLPKDFRLTNLKALSSDQQDLFLEIARRVSDVLNDGRFGVFDRYALSPYTKRFTSEHRDPSPTLAEVALNNAETIAARVTALMLLELGKSPLTESTATKILADAASSDILRELAIEALLDRQSNASALVNALRTCAPVHTSSILEQLPYLIYRQAASDKPLYAQAQSIVVSKEDEPSSTRMDALKILANMVRNGEVDGEVLREPLNAIKTSKVYQSKDRQFEIDGVALLLDRKHARTWFTKALSEGDKERWRYALTVLDWLHAADSISSQDQAAIREEMLRRSQAGTGLEEFLPTILPAFVQSSLTNAARVLNEMRAHTAPGTGTITYWTQMLEVLQNGKYDSLAHDVEVMLLQPQYLEADVPSGDILALAAGGKLPNALPALLTLTNRISLGEIHNLSYSASLVRALSTCATNASESEKNITRATFVHLLTAAEQSHDWGAANVLLEALGPVHDATTIRHTLGLGGMEELRVAAAVSLAYAKAPEGVPLYVEVLKSSAIEKEELADERAALLIETLFELDQSQSEPLIAKAALQTWGKINCRERALRCFASCQSTPTRAAFSRELDARLRDPVDYSDPFLSVAAEVIERPEIAARFFALLSHERSISQDREKFFYRVIDSTEKIEQYSKGLQTAAALAAQTGQDPSAYQRAARDYADTIAIGLLHPFRYSPDTLEYLVEMHRPGALRDAKKVAVLFTPNAGNDVMGMLEHEVRALRDHGYSVLVYECAGLLQSKISIAGACGFDACIRDAEEKLRASPDGRARVGIFCAHSIDRLMSFSKPNGDFDTDNGSLSLANEALAAKLGFDRIFTQGALLGIIGCETGHKEENGFRKWRLTAAGDNVCSMLHRLIPQAADCVGPSFSIAFARPVFDSEGNFISFEYE